MNFWFPLLFIFARIVAFVFALPFFAWRGIPVMLRVFIALTISFLLVLNWEGGIILPGSDLEMILFSRNCCRTALGFLVYLFLSVFLCPTVYGSQPV